MLFSAPILLCSFTSSSVLKRLGLSLFSVFLCSAVQAEEVPIYRCNYQGQLTFQDSPCGQGDEAIIGHFKLAPTAEPEVAEAPQAAEQPPSEATEEIENAANAESSQVIESVSLPLIDIHGRWCEVALSDAADGERIAMTPAQWDVTASTIRYQRQGFSPVKAAYHLRGTSIEIQEPSMGNWTIYSDTSDELILVGAFGGFLFLRRGDCPVS